MAQCVFDTVEEFWGEEELERARELADSLGTETFDHFENRFLLYLGSKGAAVFRPSGRAALRAALGLLGNQRHRSVIVPAFCCKAVGEAVLDAGMRPLLVDSGPAVGSLDCATYLDAIKRPDVGVAIIPHLFGLPVDIRPLLSAASQHGVVVIEDCAHCLGGRLYGEPVGTLGDFAIFSFNYDKPISLGGGGMLVCNPRSGIKSDAVSRLKEDERLNSPPASEEVQELVRFHEWLAVKRGRIKESHGVRRPFWHRAARSMFQDNVYLRWLARHLGWRAGREGGFPLPAAVGPVRAALGLVQLEQYDAVLAKRNANHDFLTLQISGSNGAQMMTAAYPVAPAWLKAKLMLPKSMKGRIDDLGRSLCSEGFQAGRFNWPRTMDEETSVVFKARRLGPVPKARLISRLSIDLPIHQNMSLDDLRRMAGHILAWLN